MLDCLAIVGVGLLGGSVAMAARKSCGARRIIGIDTRREHLETALQRSCIDEGHLTIKPHLAEAELVVLAVPVDAIVGLVDEIASAAPKAIVTDVGSTKQRIVEAFAKSKELATRFVGAHPMAGSDKSGPEFATEHLFRQTICAVTPSDRTGPAALKTVVDFWRQLGSTIVSMSPAAHDKEVAYSSHLPHLVSVALALETCQHLQSLVGPGLAGMTRLAGGNPQIWEAILAQNGPMVVNALDDMIARLQELRTALANDDLAAVARLLESAKLHQASINACRP